MNRTQQYAILAHGSQLIVGTVDTVHGNCYSITPWPDWVDAFDPESPTSKLSGYVAWENDPGFSLHEGHEAFRAALIDALKSRLRQEYATANDIPIESATDEGATDWRDRQWGMFLESYRAPVAI